MRMEYKTLKSSADRSILVFWGVESHVSGGSISGLIFGKHYGSR